MKQDCSVLILAGGKSKRMGCPKPYLDFQGETYLEKIIRIYKLGGIDQIKIVLNRNYILPIWKKLLDQIRQDAEIIVNENNIDGRFFSLKLGLQKLREANYSFIQNVDNPFINASLIDHLYDNRSSTEYVVPLFEGNGGHPIVIPKEIVQSILTITDNKASLRDVLSQYPRKELQVNDPSILVNINTPEDYLKNNSIRGIYQQSNE